MANLGSTLQEMGTCSMDADGTTMVACMQDPLHATMLLVPACLLRDTTRKTYQPRKLLHLATSSRFVLVYLTS